MAKLREKDEREEGRCGGEEWKTYSDAHLEGLLPVPTFLSYSFGIIIKVRPRFNPGFNLVETNNVTRSGKGMNFRFDNNRSTKMPLLFDHFVIQMRAKGKLSRYFFFSLTGV